MTYSELIGFCLFPEPPEVTVFPKNPVELGQPNVLICHFDRLFPPVLNVTWQLVTEGTFETVFPPSTELRFHKLHYLTFIPMAQDVYDCRVEHWGQGQPSLGHWDKQHPPSYTPLLLGHGTPASRYTNCIYSFPSETQEPVQVSETMETAICALGLVSIVVGSALILRTLHSSAKTPAPRNPCE